MKMISIKEWYILLTFTHDFSKADNILAWNIYCFLFNLKNKWFKICIISLTQNVEIKLKKIIFSWQKFSDENENVKTSKNWIVESHFFFILSWFWKWDVLKWYNHLFIGFAKSYKIVHIAHSFIIKYNIYSLFLP